MASYSKSSRQERATFAERMEEAFASLWWVGLIILACYFFYEQGLIKKDHDFKMLQSQYQSLIRQKESLATQHEALVRQINSQSDPAWVELTLMNGLGLVPEGQTKVLFTQDAELLRRNKSSL